MQVVQFNREQSQNTKRVITWTKNIVFHQVLNESNIFFWI